MEGKRVTPMKAIRLKCLDCSCGSYNEVKLCTAVQCPLHPFREGVDSFKKKREMSEDQKAALASRFRKNTPIKTGEENPQLP